MGQQRPGMRKQRDDEEACARQEQGLLPGRERRPSDCRKCTQHLEPSLAGAVPPLLPPQKSFAASTRFRVPTSSLLQTAAEPMRKAAPIACTDGSAEANWLFKSHP